jgi:sugar diacid utilization regulator
MNDRRTDVLLLESRRLREELMRTAAKLEAFAEQLIEETHRMGEENGDRSRDPRAEPSGE